MPERSTIRIEFELDDDDIEYFRNRLNDARSRHKGESEDQIIAAAQQLATRNSSSGAPHYIAQRIETLNEMIAMLKDGDWRLEGEDRAYVLNTLVYFADPHDMIPDDIPGIGLLDDAIMIDLAAQELAPELEAFREFCANREELKAGADDAEPLEAARDILQSRMRRQRRRTVRRGTSGRTSYTLFGSV